MAEAPHTNAPRALITGATGFVGSRLTSRLSQDGWFVQAIVRTTSAPGTLAALLPPENIHIHDGTTAGMIQILEKSAPDMIFHLASHFVAEHQPQDIEPIVQSNILFGAQLLEAMKVTGVKILINTATAWQHYQNAAYSPVNFYAASKQAMSGMIQYYIETAVIRGITLKLFDTYGPGDPRQKLIPILLRSAATQAVVELSPGEQMMDLVYIDDVVEAYVQAAKLLGGTNASFETYAVRSGKPISVRKLVELIESILGRPLNVRWGARPYRAREVMIPWSGGQTVPKWAVKTSLEEGIAKTISAG